MQLFADDLAFLREELGLERPVVIGHSMGGVVAFAFAASHPKLPSAIVTIDAGLAPPATVGTALSSFIDGLRGPNFRKTLGDYADAVLFLPTDDAARRAHILSVMISAPQHVMVSALEGGHAYDAVAAKGWVIVPVLHIAAEGNRLGPTLPACARWFRSSTSGTSSAQAISASSKYRPRSMP